MNVTFGLILNKKSYDGVWCGGWGRWWLRLNIKLNRTAANNTLVL